MTDEPREDDMLPPLADRVAARALVLAAISCRALIEKDAGKDTYEELRTRVIRWIEGVDIDYELEEAENLYLATPLGSLSPRDQVYGSWRSEGMVVLAWALGRSELPSYDVECDPQAVANALGFLSDREQTSLVDPELRDTDELEHWTDTYLTLHWRLREYYLRPQVIDFADMVSKCTWGPLCLDELILVDGDLAIRGQRIDRVPEGVFHNAVSIAQERHHAFNWLLGSDSTYSEVTTDT